MRNFLGRGVLREVAADGGEGGGDGKVDEEVLDPKALKAEVDRLKAENAEKDEGMRYWHEQAKGKSASPAKKEEPAVEEEEDPIELLSKKGARGLDELLAKRGFIRTSEVDERINTKASMIAAENKLVAEYPDLKDPKSEFFKATAPYYKQYIDAGVAQNLAMQFAAEKAELEGYKSGRRTKADKEEREARAKAQGGDKGKPAPAETPESTELDAFQKYICEQMEITPESYKKRATNGVVVTGSK